MKLEIYFDLLHHIPTLLITIVNFSIFGFMFYWIYKTNEIQPKRWKAFLGMLLGMFTFSLHFSFLHTPIQFPILPLGVWFLMLIIKSKNNGIRWEGFRRFAWAGFFLNFIYLILSLFINPIDQLLYPKDKLQTYITDLKQPRIISTNPNMNEVKLLNSILLNSLNTFHVEKVWNEKWYYETVTGDPKVKPVERFPYILIGTKPKLGSNLDSIIYIEKDGKGLLITTREKQYYFRSDTKIISPAVGGNNHVKK